MVKKINNIVIPSFLIVCILYLLIIGLFFLARLYFLCYYYDDLVQSDFKYYLESFLVGLRLDLIVTAYFLLPVTFTIFIPKIGWDSSLYKKIISGYGLILFIFITIFCTVNIEWFNENGNHINTMFMMYGGTGEVRSLILEEYNLLLYILIWSIIVISFFSIFKKLKNQILKSQESYKSKILCFCFTLITSIIFVRGGFQERPLDWGYAYFSNSNMGNLAAQNPIFFFGRSLLEMREENHHEKFLRISDINLHKSDFNNLILKYNNRDHSKYFNNIEYANPPNIILIILESFVAENCNFLNKNQKDNITPFLNELSKNSISFSNCFANGIRSAYGLGSILTSWPVLPGKPIISQVESSYNDASSITMDLFSKLGYDQTFIYGGDANFDNMKGFCTANGFNEVIDQNHHYFKELDKGTIWGYYDHDIFNSLFNIINEKNKQPFFTALFTTTNHAPFQIPQSYETYFSNIKTGSKKYLKAKKTMAYNDLVLKDFFDKAAKEEWYDNTIFIITADHGLTVNRSLPNHPQNGHIPFIIHSNLFSIPKKINKIVSQVDIIPTIIDILGKEKYLPLFYGKSGIQKGEGFACRMTDEIIQWITDDYIYYELIGANQKYLLSYNSIWDTTYANINSNIIMDYQKESSTYIKNAFYKFKHNFYKDLY